MLPDMGIYIDCGRWQTVSEVIQVGCDMDTATRKEDKFKSLLNSIPDSLYTVKSLADKRKPKDCVHFAVI